MNSLIIFTCVCSGAVNYFCNFIFYYRFLNIGRQIVLYSDYKLKDGSKLEINFAVRKNEQAHVWIELYGNRKFNLFLIVI